jgi:putative (di)nucleoside polyphosphate hydrolase
MSANAERFRMGVGAVIRRADGRVLALERRDIPGSWQFVQGGVRAGESVNDALFREITEETGLGRSSFGAVHEVPVWLGYELPEAARSAKTGRGQVHKWFFMEFIGSDEAVQLDGGGEFVAFQWIAIDELTDIVVPFRRPVYRELVKWSSELAG